MAEPIDLLAGTEYANKTEVETVQSQPQNGPIDLLAGTEYANKTEVETVQSQPQERSILDSVIGGVQGAGSVISGIAGEIGGGLMGIGTTLTSGPEAGADAVNYWRDKISYTPEGESAQAGLNQLGSIVAPVGEFIERGSEYAGSGVADITGSPALGALTKGAFQVTPDIMGLKTARLASQTKIPEFGQTKLKEAVTTAIQERPTLKDVINPDALSDIKLRLQNNVGDVETAKYKLSPNGKVVKDPIAIKAIKTGWKESDVANFKSANAPTKTRMKEMLNISRDGLSNGSYAMSNRPSRVVGDSMMDRVNYALDIRKKAGAQMDEVAQSLKGQDIDFGSVMKTFGKDIKAELDIDFKLVNGKMVPDFSKSAIKNLGSNRKVISNVISELTNIAKTADKGDSAYRLHRMKQFIDKQVSYGKGVKGIDATTEITLKRLRADINGRLQELSPKYKEINTQYRDTTTALNQLGDNISGKIDFNNPNANKKIGLELRKLDSNYANAIELDDAITGLNDFAKKYNVTFKDDPRVLAQFATALGEELGRPRNSVGGIFDSSAAKALAGAKLGPLGTAGLELGRKFTKQPTSAEKINALHKLLRNE